MRAYITLDYELFLGVSGTPEKCLVKPMNYLLEKLDKYSIKLNVFVDAAYLLRLRELKTRFIQLQKDYDLVIDHIANLDKQGHAIQLHLHPQWLYSEYDGEKWIIDSEHYKLSDLTVNECNTIIDEGVSILNKCISRKVTAFRGGGYCVDNFRDLYSEFLNNGITKDTSVLRGEKSRVRYKKYDYSRVPLMSSYPISTDVTKVDPKGEMTEYPISTIVVPSWKYLINKYRKPISSEFSSSKWGDGQGMGYKGSVVDILLKRSEMLFGNKCIRASIDGHGADLEKVFIYCQTNYKGDDFVIIGHPKLITPLSVNNLESFISNHPDVVFELF